MRQCEACMVTAGKSTVQDETNKEQQQRVKVQTGNDTEADVVNVYTYDGSVSENVRSTLSDTVEKIQLHVDNP